MIFAHTKHIKDVLSIGLKHVLVCVPQTKKIRSKATCPKYSHVLPQIHTNSVKRHKCMSIRWCRIYIYIYCFSRGSAPDPPVGNLSWSPPAWIPALNSHAMSRGCNHGVTCQVESTRVFGGWLGSQHRVVMRCKYGGMYGARTKIEPSKDQNEWISHDLAWFSRHFMSHGQVMNSFSQIPDELVGCAWPKIGSTVSCRGMPYQSRHLTWWATGRRSRVIALTWASYVNRASFERHFWRKALPCLEVCHDMSCFIHFFWYGPPLFEFWFWTTPLSAFGIVDGTHWK